MIDDLVALHNACSRSFTIAAEMPEVYFGIEVCSIAIIYTV